jgi:2-polyprenyl-6-methoxyphenol hydroxylase-like FAD-dependent oxidoreductase
MKIAIIGGGITGLTTGLALLRKGMDFTIYERAPALNEVGAGIWLQPNAIQVLDRLSIGSLLREQGALLNRAEITNSQLKAYSDSSSIFENESHSNNILSIHRSRLQKTLYNAIPEEHINLGFELVSFQKVEENYEMNFSNGDRITADLIIGADGIHSAVRDQVFPGTLLRYSGQTCWRGISSIILPGPYKHLGIESWGKNLRFGFAPISNTEVYWFAVAVANKGLKDEPGTIKSTLLQNYNSFNPLIRQIIQNTPEEKIIRNDISDLKRLEKWCSGNIILAGDAAHATTPNMGQGACQGIEDAYYLAGFLEECEDISSSLRAFEVFRRPKVDYVVNNSWRFGKMAHHTVGRGVMKLIMKLTPDAVIRKQMSSLYALKEID